MVTNGNWETALEEAENKLKDGEVISALYSLQKAANELSIELENRHRLGSDNRIVKAVHYTSLETVHALLTEPSKQYLRLYDSVHLTDPQEGRYVFNGSGQKSGWLESPVSHAYIISFFPWEYVDRTHDHLSHWRDRTHDHLSHWRAYGDNGRGCSMVISVPKKELYAVNYREDKRDDAEIKLSQFVTVSDKVWNGIIDKKKGSPSRYEDMLEIFATALKSRFLHKHPSYKHERERRALVAAPKQRIETEIRGRHICHYVERPEFKMDRLLTSDCRITVGPAVDHQQDVAESFRRILGKTGPRVGVSEIPYRTF